MFHLFGRRSRPAKSVRGIFFLTACFVFSLAIAAFAQEIQGNDPSTVLKQDPAKKQGSTELMTGQSKDFWDRLDLLKSTSGSERPEEGNRIRTFSLYPQSFSAAKPETLQTTPSRSYLLSLNDPGKEDMFVGLETLPAQRKWSLRI